MFFSWPFSVCVNVYNIWRLVSKYSPQNVLWLCKLWWILITLIYVNLQQNVVNFLLERSEIVRETGQPLLPHPSGCVLHMPEVSIWHAGCCRQVEVSSHAPTARESRPFKMRHLSCPASVLSYIWSVLHLICPVSNLSCIRPVLQIWGWMSSSNLQIFWVFFYQNFSVIIANIFKMYSHWS